MEGHRLIMDKDKVRMCIVIQQQLIIRQKKVRIIKVQDSLSCHLSGILIDND